MLGDLFSTVRSTDRAKILRHDMGVRHFVNLGLASREKREPGEGARPRAGAYTRPVNAVGVDSNCSPISPPPQVGKAMPCGNREPATDAGCGLEVPGPVPELPGSMLTVSTFRGKVTM